MQLSSPITSRPVSSTAMRRGVALTLVLILIQAALGMTVNLYVGVPSTHPGAKPSSAISSLLMALLAFAAALLYVLALYLLPAD